VSSYFKYQINLFQKRFRVAAYVFFFVLTFLLFFLQCYMRCQCRNRSKATLSPDRYVASHFNFHNCRLYNILFSRCLRLLLRPHFYTNFPAVCYVSSAHSPFRNKLFSTEVDLLLRNSISRITPCP
jgi:hypothetical protein